jgi:ribosomal-protein-alanine N-acetyltransferase
VTTEPSSARPGLRLDIRPMRQGDLGQVLAIERRSHATPWSESMFVSELGRRDGIALIAVDGGRPVGYVMVARQVEVWHVLNVAVHPDRRGEGIGESLMTTLFEIGDRRDHRGYTLEVRVSNATAIRLYRRLGFEDHGIRPRYYSDNGEDALIMWRLGHPAEA